MGDDLENCERNGVGDTAGGSKTTEEILSENGSSSPMTEVNTSDTTEPEDTDSEAEVEGSDKGTGESDAGTEITETAGKKGETPISPGRKATDQSLATESLQKQLASKKEKLIELRENYDAIEEENQRLALKLEEIQNEIFNEKRLLWGRIENEKQLARELWGRVTTLRTGIKDLKETVTVLINKVNPDEIEESSNSNPETVNPPQEKNEAARLAIAQRKSSPEVVTHAVELMNEARPTPATASAPLPIIEKSKPPQRVLPQVELYLEKVPICPPRQLPSTSSKVTKKRACVPLTKGTRNVKPKQKHAIDLSKSDLGFYCTCGVYCPTKVGLNTHILYHTSPHQFRCTVTQCGKRFFTTTMLRLHMKIQHQINYETEGIMGCRRCGKTFPNRMQFYTHLKSAHNCGPMARKGVPTGKRINRQRQNCVPESPMATDSTKDTKAKPIKPSNRQICCPHCPHKFSRKGYLQRHIDNRHKSIVNKASPMIITTGIPKKQAAPGHHGVKRMDVEGKRFICLCGKYFATSGSLREHVKLKMGLTQNKCRICSETFPRYDYLQLHLKRKHNLTTSGPACRICGETGFSSGHEIKIHRRDAHGIDFSVRRGKRSVAEACT